jgi:hypothetical protein
MNRNKLLIRHFPSGVSSGTSTRHYDELQILEKFGDGAYHYSQTQVLFLPSCVEVKSIPVWGFMLNNSTSVQTTYPVLVVLDDTDDSVQEQLKKFQEMDRITFSIAATPVRASGDAEGRCDPASIQLESFSATAEEDVNISRRPTPWIFDHWTCQNR